MDAWWDSIQLDELFNKFCSAQIKSRVMLDARLTYSCGYWKEAKTLDQTQEHKFGPDYDKTLMCWFENPSENWEKIKDNYDDQFFLM